MRTAKDATRGAWINWQIDARIAPEKNTPNRKNVCPKNIPQKPAKANVGACCSFGICRSTPYATPVINGPEIVWRKKRKVRGATPFSDTR
jgi:hypothetical protein